MQHVRHLRCLICGARYAPDEVEYVCPLHGNDGTLDVVYDYERIGSSLSRDQLRDCDDRSMWRYKQLLPVAIDAPVPPLSVGGTPLYRTRRLGAQNGLEQLWVKDDGRNPTASFKDRASAIALIKAQALKAEVITTASTGNAAAALAGICASVGQPCVIFVPKTAPEAKVAQLLAYGATVMAVDGSYDDAFELCLEAADAFGWYNRNTGYNPYMTEGKKTVSYEIAEQLQWQAPDLVVVSVGDGSIIGGVHKGFRDLLTLGWIERMPRLIGVQADGSSFLAEAWRNGEDVVSKPAINAQTVADSISAGLPRDRIKGMRAVVETQGAFISVSDSEILAAIPALASFSGVFAEPASAAAYAGLQKGIAEGIIEAHERVVLINSGNGLKDVRAAIGAVAQAPFAVRPRLEEVREIVKTL